MYRIDDIIVNLVIYTDVGFLALTALLLLLVIFLRFHTIQKEKRRTRFTMLWHPILEQSMYVMPESLPRVDASNFSSFMFLWNNIQENIRGEVKENLSIVARRANIKGLLKKKLAKGNLNDRLLAINMVGHLREKSVWNRLVSIISENEKPVLVLTAAKAIARIDGQQAAEVFIPLLASHREWPLSGVAAVLGKLKPEVVAGVLGKVILEAQETEVPRLMHCLRFATPRMALATALALTRKYDSVEVIAACLNIIAEYDSGEYIGYARANVGHPDWVVRLRVVQVLSKIGTREDISLLRQLLTDREWWIRYRAARALTGLPFVTMSEIEVIIAEQKDRYAADALKQAFAEKQIVS